MKKILFSLVTLLTVLGLSAAPINEQQARQIAASFFAQGGRAASADLTLAWAGNDLYTLSGGRAASSSTAEFSHLYIYNRGNNGFAIVAGDDAVAQPVIAYSFERAFDVNNIAPATRELLSAWGRQIAATQGGRAASRSTDLGTDLCYYSTALWSQDAPYNREAPTINGQPCVTGCVATAMAIIAHYHKWPEKGVGTTPEYTVSANGLVVPANTLGRTYDYANMLSDYSHGYTDVQGNAVAALMKDMGTSVEMGYGIYESYAYFAPVITAMSTYFGYSKQSSLVGEYGRSYDEWIHLLQQNLIKNGPTFMGAQNYNYTGGHAFVLQGCTTTGYFYINYGWGGFGNGAYIIPEFQYYRDQHIAMDMVPDRTGTTTYRDCLTLLTYNNSYCGLRASTSKFVSGEEFDIYIGGVYNSGSVSFSGSYQLVLCDKTGAVKEQILSPIQLNDLPIGYLTAVSGTVKITAPLAEGDCLRIRYKGQYSGDEWLWAESYDSGATSKIIVVASPEQVADQVSFSYLKGSREIVLSTVAALQYKVTDALGNTKAEGQAPSRTAATIDASDYEPGEYTLSIASGGNPHQMIIVL